MFCYSKERVQHKAKDKATDKTKDKTSRGIVRRIAKGEGQGGFGVWVKVRVGGKKVDADHERV